MGKQSLKLASLLIALTFQGGLLTDAVGLHGCPIHDALPGAMSMGAGDHGGAMAMDGPAHRDHGTPGHEEHGRGGPCTCVGACQNGVDFSHAVAAPPAPMLAAGATFEAPISSAVPELPSSPAFLLPYSHGPPLVA